MEIDEKNVCTRIQGAPGLTVDKRDDFGRNSLAIF